MNKEYHVSDVIFGLREEYLKIEALLNELKKNVYVHDKRVEDFYFYLATYYSKKYPELLCNVEKKRNIVMQKLISFAKEKGFYIYVPYSGQVYQDFNHNCFVQSKYNFQIDSQERFDSIIRELFNSPFVQNIDGSSVRCKKGKSEFGVLELAHNLVDFTGERIIRPLKEYTGCVQYIPRLDEIQYTDYTKKQVPPSEFSDMLNATLNAEDLPPYLQGIIDHWKKENAGFQLIDDSFQKEYAAYSVENIQGQIFLRRNYTPKK